MGRALHFSSSLLPCPLLAQVQESPLFWAYERVQPELRCLFFSGQRMEISEDIHLRPKQPTLHNLPCPSHPCPMAHVCACEAAAPPLAAFLDGRSAISQHHLGMIRKLAPLPLSPSHFLTRSRLLLYASLSLPELRWEIREKLKKQNNSDKKNDNYEIAIATSIPK